MFEIIAKSLRIELLADDRYLVKYRPCMFFSRLVFNDYLYLFSQMRNPPLDLNTGKKYPVHDWYFSFKVNQLSMCRTLLVHQ